MQTFHAICFKALFTPPPERFKTLLGIGMAGKIVFRFFQFIPNITKPPNLPVSADSVAVLRFTHWLVHQRENIDNHQPPATQSDFDVTAGGVA